MIANRLPGSEVPNPAMRAAC